MIIYYTIDMVDKDQLHFKCYSTVYKDFYAQLHNHHRSKIQAATSNCKYIIVKQNQLYASLEFSIDLTYTIAVVRPAFACRVTSYIFEKRADSYP